MAPDLAADQLERYSRHLLLEDVGPAGQETLLESSVLVVGAGGLGSPVMQYLAGAGVGRLGIVDDDTVERSNLQRQVIHGEDDVGRPKVESAREFVAGLNPDVTVDARKLRVDAASARDLVSEYDVVVDASDNFPTRFLLNDACVLDGVPLCQGAVFRFEGQVTTFTGGRPCYRCLFPEAPPAGAVPDCATAGVLGVVPGTVGAIQATEALKVLLGKGDVLEGTLRVFDARTTSLDTVEFEADPACPVCGEGAELASLSDQDYTGDCSLAE